MDQKEIKELRQAWLTHRDMAGMFTSWGILELAKKHYKLAFKLWRFYNESNKA